jgi:nucleotide-binding universal stress UspA family protein
MKDEVDRVRIYKIVAAIDVSQRSKTVMEKTNILASAFDSDVYLLSVVEMPKLAAEESDISMSDIKNEEDEFSKHHKLLIDKYFTGSSLLVESVVLHGNPASKICSFAESVTADVIIIGSKNKSGFKKIFLESVSQVVSNNAPCSVLIVRERKKKNINI